MIPNTLCWLRMANLTTEGWHPDTCGCAIHHQFMEGSGAPPPDEEGNLFVHCSPAAATVIRAEKHELRVVEYARTGNVRALLGEATWWGRQEAYEESICEFHPGLTDGPQRYLLLRDENGRKNITENIISNERPDYVSEALVKAWEGLDDQRILSISFLPFKRDRDGNRIVLDPILSAEKTQIQAAADLQFGPNKVLFL